jgi:hypothetical protein
MKVVVEGEGLFIGGYKGRCHDDLHIEKGVWIRRILRGGNALEAMR